MIECPRCGSVNTSAAGGHPRKVKRVVIRQHRCRECGMDFRSYQFVIEDRETADLAADVLGVA